MHHLRRAEDRIDRTHWMHLVQPMHTASSISATVRGASTPCAGSSGFSARPSSAASARMPAAPPGGHWLMSASPAAIAVRVRAAAGVLALTALRLRQERVDAFGQRPRVGRRHVCTRGGVPQREPEHGRERREQDDRFNHGCGATPAKPMNASAMKPAVRRSSGTPRNACGMSPVASRRRIAASIASTST